MVRMSEGADACLWAFWYFWHHVGLQGECWDAPPVRAVPHSEYAGEG